MSHAAFVNIAEEIAVQDGAIVSKVAFEDATGTVTLLAFDTGQAQVEQRSPRHTIVQVLEGRVEIILDNHTFDAGPGAWFHVDPEIAHSLVAARPSKLLKTQI
jgi:quercetin dioxygenase-like cupin family protein